MNSNAAQLPRFASTRVSDSCNNWEHAGPESTPDAIADYYRSAGYEQLGYDAHPDQDTSVDVRIDLCDEDGDVVETHAVVTVEIPADPKAE